MMKLKMIHLLLLLVNQKRKKRKLQQIKECWIKMKKMMMNVRIKISACNACFYL